MSAYVELSFDSVENHSTQNAICFDMGEKEPQWIPVSMIDMERFDPEEHKLVYVNEWWATREGLI